MGRADRGPAPPGAARPPRRYASRRIAAQAVDQPVRRPGREVGERFRRRAEQRHDVGPEPDQVERRGPCVEPFQRRGAGRTARSASSEPGRTAPRRQGGVDCQARGRPRPGRRRRASRSRGRRCCRTAPGRPIACRSRGRTRTTRPAAAAVPVGRPAPRSCCRRRRRTSHHLEVVAVPVRLGPAAAGRPAPRGTAGRSAWSLEPLHPAHHIRQLQVLARPVAVAGVIRAASCQGRSTRRRGGCHHDPLPTPP